MLSFLRKIRKSLVDVSNFKKYSLYAAGEIALVVIGILIALQINNWNEWRKDRIKEKKVLEQVIETIKINSDHFHSAILGMKRNKERTEEVISIINNKTVYEESMNELFHSVRVNRRLTLTTAGYEELKNTGFDIIQNDSLKIGIVNLFESTYSETLTVLDKVELYTDRFTEFIVANFLEIEYNKLAPVDYSLIINNHFYYSSLLHIISIRTWRIGLIEKSLEENNKILHLIKEELGQE